MPRDAIPFPPPRPMPLSAARGVYLVTAALIAAMASWIATGLKWPGASPGHVVPALVAALCGALVANFALRQPERLMGRSLRAGLVCGSVPTGLAIVLAAAVVVLGRPQNEMTGLVFILLLMIAGVSMVAGLGLGVAVGLVGLTIAGRGSDDALDAAEVRVLRASTWIALAAGPSAWIAADQGDRYRLAASLAVLAAGAAGALVVHVRSLRRAAWLRRVVQGSDPHWILVDARTAEIEDDLPRYVAIDPGACDAALARRNDAAEGTPFRASARAEPGALIDSGARRALSLIRRRSHLALALFVAASGVFVWSTVMPSHPPPPRFEPPRDAARPDWQPHRVPLPGVATQVAIAENGACAVLAGGDVACWGTNNGRFPGLPDTVEEPALLPGVRGAKSVALSHNHACAIVEGGAVECWGKSWIGELGDGLNLDRAQPVKVVGLSGVKNLALFYHTSCASTQDGAVWCWGQQLGGVCGDAGCIGGKEPQRVRGLARIEEIGRGSEDVYARDEGGKVFWVGRDRNLKSDDAGAPGEPVLLGLPAPARRLATGTFAGCALLRDGGATCWGDDDTAESVLARDLHPVEQLRGAVDVAVGLGLTCALHADRTVSCWGDNQYGALGDRTTRSRSASDPVLGVDDVEQLTADRGFVCALRRDGAVWCWGWLHR